MPDLRTLNVAKEILSKTTFISNQESDDGDPTVVTLKDMDEQINFVVEE